MYYIIVALFILVTPHLGHAQTTGSLQGLIAGTLGFLDAVIIPVILGIAFLMIVWNVLRFFVIGADNEESQQNAKNLALYSVLAFVLILSFWGIVAILTNGIGLPSSDVPCEDMQFDYYQINTSDLAPCSSPIPRPRPNATVSAGTTGGSIPPASSASTGATGSTIPPNSTDTNDNPTSFDPYGNIITTTPLPDREIVNTINGVAGIPVGSSVTYTVAKGIPVNAVVSGTVVAAVKSSTSDVYNFVIQDNNGNYVLMSNISPGYPPPSAGTIVVAGNTIGYSADTIVNTNANIIVVAYLGAGKTWNMIRANATDPSVVLDTATYLKIKP